MTLERRLNCSLRAGEKVEAGERERRAWAKSSERATVRVDSESWLGLGGERDGGGEREAESMRRRGQRGWIEGGRGRREGAGEGGAGGEKEEGEEGGGGGGSTTGCSGKASIFQQSEQPQNNLKSYSE